MEDNGRWWCACVQELMFFEYVPSRVASVDFERFIGAQVGPITFDIVNATYLHNGV
jgi:hypothetical protein